MKYTKQQVVEAIKAFRNAAVELTNRWTDMEGAEGDEFSEQYPFKESFDELVFKIDEWYEESKSVRTCMTEGCDNPAPDMELDCRNCSRNLCRDCAESGTCDCLKHPFGF